MSGVPLPPSPDHSLLAAFYFGDDPPSYTGPEVIDAGIRPIRSDHRYECWWYQGDVSHRIVDGVRIAECDDYAFVTLQHEDAPADAFRQVSYDAYKALLRGVAASRHDNVVRIWNYFPHINEGAGDAEKYRQFSVGRAEAFDELGAGLEIVPAGTATGAAEGGPVSIVALVSKHAFRPAENPRQVSAYKYPRRYGPKSPKFSRGGSVAAGDHYLFLISGTAAVVGHESAHPYETTSQITETLENLERLSSVLSEAATELPRLELDEDCVLRVYLRTPDDYDLVAGILGEALGHIGDNVIFLHSDICRRELMVEIDGTRCFPTGFDDE